jgi:hypothetical protein
MKVGDLVHYKDPYILSLFTAKLPDTFLITWLSDCGKLCKLLEFPDNQVFRTDGMNNCGLELVNASR